MEREAGYTVEITAEAEIYYYEVLEYFYKHHSESSADRKSQELIDKAVALKDNPLIGRIEENLKFLGKGHQYLLYFYTGIKAIKIIYFVNESSKKVYITDFFPCESNESRITTR